MNLEQCYQLFNLLPGATSDEIRAAYRKLARIMHPDVNPEDLKAHDRFVTLNQAYQLLIETSERPLEYQVSAVRIPKKTPEKSPVAKPSPTLSRQDADLKWQTYQKLQELLRNREFVKTIALVDGLAQRMESDQDVKQWQGIVYYFFGQHLIDRDQLDKARIYLKKALKADPNNAQLVQQVKHEHSRIEQIMARL
jgi:tetratricopeptide (TPR) repeat protein